MPVLLHAKNITYADCTDPNKLRPSDWNSSHNQYWTLQGNTLGASTLSGTNIQLAGGNNITLSAAGQVISIVGANTIAIGIKHNAGDSTANTTFTSGEVIFSNKYATGGDLAANIHFKNSNNSISAALYPQELSNDYYVQFGRSDLNNVPYLDVWKSDSYCDIHFPMTGSAANNIVMPSFTDAASRTLEVAGHLHGVTLNLTNITATTGWNTAGMQLSMSAGAGGGGVALIASNSTWTSGTVQISGNGNVTVSYNANTILISAGGGGGGAAISAAGASASDGTVVFSNSNNVSFGMNGSTVTATATIGHTGPTAIVASTVTVTAGSVVFTGSNNITVSANGSTITISGANTHAQQTGISSIVASNTTITSGGVTFTGVNNITVTYNGQTISISGANTHAQQTGISGIVANAASTVSAGSVVFSNSNGVSFGFNGSTMTGSVAQTGSIGISANGSSQGAGLIVFSNSNGVSFGMNGSTITATVVPGAAAGIAAIADSAATITSGTVVFSNGGNVSFGIAGNTITASAPAGGGGYTKSIKFLHEDFVGFNTGTVASSEGTQYIFTPFHMDNDMSCSQLMVLKSLTCATATSSNSSGRQGLSYALSVYIFKRQDFGANSSNLTYYTSGSGGLTCYKSHTSNNVSFSISFVTNSTGGTSSVSTTSTGSAWQSIISGPRFFMVPMVTSFSAGEWFIAYRHSSTTATTGSNAVVMTVSGIGYSMQTGIGMVHVRIGSSNTNLSNPFHGIGFGSATAITTTNTMAATVISAGSSALRLRHAVLVNMAWPM